MQVPLLDLEAAYGPQKQALEEAVLKVMRSQRFIQGPLVADLEAKIADYVGAKAGIGCASGTDALVLALMALEIGPGDEVITTPYSFFATAGCVARVGAKPVFVDIDPQTYNICLDGVERAIGPRTKAIIPVHLFGQPVDMDRLMAMANAKSIPVIEDAAQAIGAKWKDQRAGAIGAVGCYSFYPSKNLGAFGDGGMMVTSDPELETRLRSLCTHGNYPRKYYHRWVGLNSRLDAMQAAILLVRFEALESWHEGRRKNAAAYRQRFAAANLGPDCIEMPHACDEAWHIYNQFVIRTPHRDALQAYLKEKGVGSMVYYPRPLHLQACFEDLGYQLGDFPESERAAETTLALPVYPQMTDAQQNYVVETIQRFFASRGVDTCPKN